MSCRDTRGNSAVTSYAHISAPADVPEHVVQQCFHDLKRRATTIAAPDPQPEDVSAFLSHQQFLVRNDPNLSEARKRSLNDRFSQAQAEAAAGSLPDPRTFYAWQNLAGEVEVARRTRQARPNAAARDDAERLRRREDRIRITSARSDGEESRRVAKRHLHGRSSATMEASGLRTGDEVVLTSPSGLREVYDILGTPTLALDPNPNTGTMTPRVTYTLRQFNGQTHTVTCDATTPVTVRDLTDQH